MPTAVKTVSARTRSAHTVAPDIEDNCIVHAGNDVESDNNVIVGHGAVVHSRKVRNNVLIEMFTISCVRMPLNRIHNNW